MDTSAPAAKDAHDQTAKDQPVDPASSAQSMPSKVSTASGSQSDDTSAQVKPAPSKQQISISGGGGLEAGSAMLVTEDPDDDDEDEALQVAPQEKKNLGVMGQGDTEEQDDEQQIVGQSAVTDVAEETVEMQPVASEVAANSPEVEKLIEITPPEQPKISDELKNIGVTHSGPGVIPQATFAPAKIPVSYEQALNEEEKIKSNRLHSSKFWLLEKIKYLLRKVNPNIAATVKKSSSKKIVAAKPAQVVQAKTQDINIQ
jgi:hypothetical protein